MFTSFICQQVLAKTVARPMSIRRCLIGSSSVLTHRITLTYNNTVGSSSSVSNLFPNNNNIIHNIPITNLGQSQERSFHTTGFLSMSSSSTTASSMTLQESYDNILVETFPESKTAMITLNRPKALNALSDALLKDLLHATEVLDQDSQVRCIVLTGSAKAFAAGADISEMKSKSFEHVYAQDMFQEWQLISRLKTPILAAVSGYCLGGGCELALMCDMMICSSTAKFGQPEINLGVIPGAGGTQRLTRAIGKSKAMYMNLTGEFINADEAYQCGLVAKVFENHDELCTKSLEIAKVIASKGTLAVQAAKEAVNAADELSLQEGLRLERRLFHSLFATEDQKEGMAAFLEKRPANFK